MAEHVAPGRPRLDTDAWQRDRGRHPCHATVAHGVREWVRKDKSDDQREVHGHTCEGAGAALRTYWRAVRGVHKQSLHLSVATYEATVKTKRVTPKLIRRMGLGDLTAYTGYT
jgi:hypothetical protein